MSTKFEDIKDDREVMIEMIKNTTPALEEMEFPVVMSRFFDMASKIQEDDSALRIHALGVLLSGNVDKISRVYPDLMSNVVNKLLNSSTREERALLRLLHAERSDVIPKQQADKLGFVAERKEMSTSCYVFVKTSLAVVLVSVLAALFLDNSENLRGIGACAAAISCLVGLAVSSTASSKISKSRRRELLESVLNMSLNCVAKSYVPPPKIENKVARRKNRRGQLKKKKKKEEDTKTTTTTTTNSSVEGMYKNQIDLLNTLKETATNTGVAKVPLSKDIMETASKLEIMLDKSGVSNETTESFRHAMESLRKRENNE